MKKRKVFSLFVALTICVVCLLPANAASAFVFLNGGTLNADGVREFQYGTNLTFQVSGYAQGDWIGIYYAHDFEFLATNACRSTETINTWKYVNANTMTVDGTWKPDPLFARGGTDSFLQLTLRANCLSAVMSPSI